MPLTQNSGLVQGLLYFSRLRDSTTSETHKAIPSSATSSTKASVTLTSESKGGELLLLRQHCARINSSISRLRCCDFPPAFCLNLNKRGVLCKESLTALSDSIRSRFVTSLATFQTLVYSADCLSPGFPLLRLSQPSQEEHLLHPSAPPVLPQPTTVTS